MTLPTIPRITPASALRAYRALPVLALLGGVFFFSSALLADPPKTKAKTAAQQCDDRFLDLYAKCQKERPQLSDSDCWKAAVAGWKTCRNASGVPVKASEQPPRPQPNLTTTGVTTAQTTAPGTRVGIKPTTAPTSLRMAAAKAAPSPTPVKKRPTAPLPAPQTGTFMR